MPKKLKKKTNYLFKILDISFPYLKKSLSNKEINKLIKLCNDSNLTDTKKIIKNFSENYCQLIKEKYQSKYKNSIIPLDDFVNTKNDKVKILWGDCFNVLKKFKSESVHLMVTSPPYYNARDYSTWDNLNMYLDDMKSIIKECYRVLDNHRAFVFNVGDITGNDNLHTTSSWGSRRIPLGAYFINIFEQVGFKFIDDFVWDKGQVESQRHKNGDTPNPLYQYPMNCYEHILIFYKHRQDYTLYPCPVCGCLKVNGNAHSGVGIRSWECKNLNCFERSESNRGKRFSMRSMIMESLKHNIIDKDFIKKWRRDIIKINPKIKINCKGENTLGHTAPFPKEIPEFAIKTLSGKGEKVLDPFAGSFTTAIEAINQDRIGIGIELNKNMFFESIKNNILKNGLDFEDYE